MSFPPRPLAGPDPSLLAAPAGSVGLVQDDAPYRNPPYRIEYISQPVDHLNGLTSNETFLQRYLHEDSNFTAGGPIFAFTGAEGGNVTLFYGSYAAPINLARRLGGRIIFMEMRFFGASRTFNASGPGCAAGLAELCPTSDRLGLLGVEQVLADYSRLLTEVLKGCGAKCATSPVITFGGSLAGTLAAAMRLTRPWLVDFAWSSSAPLFGFEGVEGVDQYSWRRQITTNWQDLGSPACVGAVRRGFSALASARQADILTAFNVCNGTGGTDPRAAIQGIGWGILEGDGLWVYPPSKSRIPGKCAAMLHGADFEMESGVRGSRYLGRGGAGGVGLGIFRALIDPPPPPSCLNLTQHTTRRPKGVSWDYLACTEILHPIGSNNRTDFFPPGPYVIAEIAAGCRREFHAPHLTPRPRHLPTQLGLFDLKRFARAASHVLFTYGSRDPWATLGVGRSDLSPTLPVLVVPNGTHCADMGPDRPWDTRAMLAARQSAYRILSDWIQRRRVVESSVEPAQRAVPAVHRDGRDRGWCGGMPRVDD